MLSFSNLSFNESLNLRYSMKWVFFIGMMLSGVLTSDLISSSPQVYTESEWLSNDLAQAPTDEEDPLKNYPELHQNRHEKESDSFKSKFMNMLILLVLLIGAMYLTAWALRRMTKTRISQLNTSSVIKIIETRQLSHKGMLHLIDIEGQTILIAESPNGISHLASIVSNGRQDTEVLPG